MVIPTGTPPPTVRQAVPHRGMDRRDGEQFLRRGNVRSWRDVFLKVGMSPDNADKRSHLYWVCLSRWCYDGFKTGGRVPRKSPFGAFTPQFLSPHAGQFG
nr:hypothetical transcript [Hymenolepis microstoma]